MGKAHSTHHLTYPQFYPHHPFKQTASSYTLHPMSYNYTPKLPKKLTAPEVALIEATANGKYCELGDGTRPSENSTDPTRIIRAEVIIFLALGGDDKNTVDPRGVSLLGAYIPNQLDLANAPFQ